MTDDNFTPTLAIILSAFTIGFLPGLLFGTVTARQETEEEGHLKNRHKGSSRRPFLSYNNLIHKGTPNDY